MPYQASLDWLNFLLADVRGGLGPYVSVFPLTEAHWDQAAIGAVLTVSGIIGITLHMPLGAHRRHPSEAGILVAGICILAVCALAITRAPIVPVALAADVAMAVFGGRFATRTLAEDHRGRPRPRAAPKAPQAASAPTSPHETRSIRSAEEPTFGAD